MKTIITFLSILLTASLLYSQSSIVFDAGTNIDVGAGADISAGTITVNGTYSGGGTFDNGPLPVELVSFIAHIVNDNVELKWKTVTEVDNYGFEIQRSQKSGVRSQNENQSQWEVAGFVKGNGNSNSVKEYSFVDDKISGGNYLYRLKQINNDGTFEYSKTVVASFIKPTEFSLLQNYPNPFNPTTNLEFRISDFGLVTLKVYDILGNEVASLVNEEKEPGIYSVEFNGSSLSSGVYYYTLTAGQFTQTKKLLLMK